LRTGSELIFSAVSMTSDIWSADERKAMVRVTNTGDVLQAAACIDRGFLIAARIPPVGKIEMRRVRADGTVQNLALEGAGLPACSHRGGGWWWYTDFMHIPSTTFRCDRSSACTVIARGVGLGFSLSPDDSKVAFLANSNRGVRVRWMPSGGGASHELGESETGCAPGWSSDRTLWISRRLRGLLTWTEIEVESGKPTGRTAPGSKNCTDGLPDPLSPADLDARVVFNFETDIRLKTMAQ